MLNLTRQERLVIQFLALFFVIGSAIYLIRENVISKSTINISQDSEEAQEFKARAEVVDSVYSQQISSPAVNVITENKIVKSRINLNSATLEELMTLPKIGPVTAQRIVDYRTTHNGITNINELKNVKGIGEKTLERLKNEVCIE